MQYLSLMQHITIQTFTTTKTYHNYAYLLEHTRTLTITKCRIAHSQKLLLPYAPTLQTQNILQLHTHNQNKYGTPSTNILTPHAPNTTNNTYETHTQTKIKEMFAVPHTALTLNHQNTRYKVDRQQTYYSCIFYLFLYTY